MNILKIELPIYKTFIYVWYGSEKEAEREYKDTKYYNDDPNIKFDGAGKTIHKYRGCPIIWIKKDKKIEKSSLIGTITHESFHAVMFIMMDRGCCADGDNNEHFAYFIEFLTKIIIDEFNILKK